MRSATVIGWRLTRARKRRRLSPVHGVAVSAAAAAAAVLSVAQPFAPGRERPAPSAPGAVAAAADLGSLPPAARPLVSRTLGRSDAAFSVRLAGGSLVAANPSQGLTASFGTSGVAVREQGASIRIALEAIGRGKRLTPVAGAVPRARANAVVYRRGSLTEWYANGPLGLEQGFTVARRVAGTGPLALSLALHGAPAALDQTGRSLALGDSGLRYTGLSAHDARGRSLPAHLALRGTTLRVIVDDRGARFPITIDPLIQAAKLTASDGALLDELGHGRDVAVSGDTIVAGAPGADIGNQQNAGAAYVFVKPPSGWANASETAKLVASDGQAGDLFGDSASVSGDTIVIGAPGNTSSEGAAYVFVKPPSGWVSTAQTAKLTASTPAPSDSLGFSAAISGDTVVAGAPNVSGPNGPSEGALYVFSRPLTGWVDETQTGELTVPNSAIGAALGWSVAIDGDTVVGGMPRAGDLGGATSEVGSAFVFVRPGASWGDMPAPTARLVASDDGPYDDLGYSVALSGGTAVAGSPGDEFGNPTRGGQNDRRGAAYVFVEPPGGWSGILTESAKLTASDAAPNDILGFSVAVSNDTVAAGAPAATIGSHGDQGAVYEFVKPAAGWANETQTAKLVASDGAAGDEFGASLGFDASTLAASAVGSNGATGAAYVFQEQNATITLTKSLLPSTDPGRFNLKVGKTVVASGVGDGGTGTTSVHPGTYVVSETAAAGTTLSSYASTIACMLNGGAGPSGTGTKLTVTVAAGDRLACTLTNSRKATIIVRKALVPSTDPGRFNLKVGSKTVFAGAGNGDFGSLVVVPGPSKVAETAVKPASLKSYTSSIACTRNGGPGPSGSGTSLNVMAGPGDVLDCTITNTRK
jgi:hypothetical protein